MTSLKRAVSWTLALVLGLLLLAVVALAVFAATFDAERYKPLAVDWMRSTYNRTLAIDGPVKLSVFPRLAVGVSGVKLSEAGRPDTFAEVASADVALELLPLLRGQVQASRITARGVRLAWRRDAQGKSNIDDLLAPQPKAAPDAAAGESSGGLPALDVAGIDLQDVVLRVDDALGGVVGSLALARLNAGRIAPGLETPVELQAQLDFTQPDVKGELRGNTLVRLAEPATAGAPATLGVTLGESKLAFVGTAGGTRFGRAEIALAGTAYTPATRKLELQKLKLALDVTPPQQATQQLTLEGSASASPKLLAWDLQGRWRAPGNDGPLSTSGRYALDTGVVDAKAQLQSLDVDALRAGSPQAPAGVAPAPVASAPAASVSKVAGKAATGASGDNTPVDLSAAAWLKGTVDATLGTLVANGIRFSDMRVVLKGDGRTLDAAPFSAKVWSGQIQGRAQVQPAARRVSLVAEATGIRIEQALKDVSGRDTVQGVGRLDLDLATGGQTIGQMKSQLAGRAALQLRDGAVKGFNLAELGRKAKAALALKKDDFEKARSTEKTDFSEISASFAIAGGVARSNDLAAKSPYLRVTGEGTIDVPRSSIDYTAFVTVTDTSKGQGGADLALLEGVRLPVRLTGPLDAVQYQVQWSAVGGALAKEAVKNKLEEKLGLDSKESKDAFKEKARQKLKGLFK